MLHCYVGKYGKSARSFGCVRNYLYLVLCSSIFPSSKSKSFVFFTCLFSFCSCNHVPIIAMYGNMEIIINIIVPIPNVASNSSMLFTSPLCY